LTLTPGSFGQLRFWSFYADEFCFTPVGIAAFAVGYIGRRDLMAAEQDPRNLRFACLDGAEPAVLTDPDPVQMPPPEGSAIF